jgi:hypothetical protein
MRSLAFKIIVGLAPIAMITGGTYLTYGTGPALIVGGAAIWASYLIGLRTRRSSESAA